MAPRTKRSDRNSLVTPRLNTPNVRADTGADQFTDRIARSTDRPPNLSSPNGCLRCQTFYLDLSCMEDATIH